MATSTETKEPQEIQSEALVTPDDDIKSGQENTEPQESHPTGNSDLWQSLAERLGADVQQAMLQFLVRSAPTRELWKLLGQSEHLPLQARLTKGFQRTAGALRQTPVRNRLVHEMQASSTLTVHLLHLWTETSPTVLITVREAEQDEALTAQLPQLWKRFGTESLFWSLFVEGRESVLTTWTEQIANGELAPDDEIEASQPDERSILAEVVSPSLEKPLQEAREAAAKWKTRAELAESKLRAAESAFTSERSEHSKQNQELRAQARQQENRSAVEHQKLTESEKNLDRTARKLKSTEKQLEDVETESKRLKKQVRQQQELNEELKKEAAGLHAKIEAMSSQVEAVQKPAVVPSALPKPVPPAVLRFDPAAATIAPQEQQFIWDADGRTIRVTPRDIKRAIDRNDEQFVFALIQAVDALRQISTDGFKLLVERLTEYDRYYAQVLTRHTTRILVDASNVARYEKNRFGKGQMRFLLAMRQELRNRNCFPIRFIADASLPYNIDSPEELSAMVKRSELELSAPGQEADEILAREARRSGAFVVSNDRTFHHKVSPGFEPPRVGFQFFDSYVVVDEF